MSWLNQRELGGIEACDRLNGNFLFQFDLANKWLNTNPPSRRVRTLKPKAALEKIAAAQKKAEAEGKKVDPESQYTNSFVDNYYPSRPKALEKFSLFNIFCNYE